MIRAVLMLLAPAQKVSVIPCAEAVQCKRMATRPAPLAVRHWWHMTVTGLAVVANALGLMLFLAGLGLVLRLAEVSLS